MTIAPWESSDLIVGSAATIRLSSVILPSSSGTLKSTRTKTRLPAASRSRIVSLFIDTSSLAWPDVGTRGRSDLSSRSGFRRWLEALGDELGEVGDAAAVAPLVVVPGKNLDEVAGPADDHRQRGVDDRGARVGLEVHRDERLVADAEDALERTRGGLAEGVVDGLGRSLVT